MKATANALLAELSRVAAVRHDPDGRLRKAVAQSLK
jgi:hypothetical protein